MMNENLKISMEFNKMTGDEVNENLKICGFKSRTVMRRKRHEGAECKANIRGYENDQALNDHLMISEAPTGVLNS